MHPAGSRQSGWEAYEQHTFEVDSDFLLDDPFADRGFAFTAADGTEYVFPTSLIAGIALSA